MNIRNYFAFTRGERRGSLVLTSLLLITFCLRFVDYSGNGVVTTEFDAFDKEVTQFLNDQASADAIDTSMQFFDFNPNNASNEQWRQLGFKDWQIKSINKYKNKGGSWKIKSDVAKIYGVSETHFESLKPYIQLPEQLTFQKNKQAQLFNFNPNATTKAEWEKLGFKPWQIENIENFKNKGGIWKSKAEFSKLYGLKESKYQQLAPFILLPDEIKKSIPFVFTNINQATAEELTQLEGINSKKYAAIIIKYRDKLGGFHTKDQLLEVWGMKLGTYQKFEPQVIIAPNSVQQLNINSSTANELVKHPYINWKVANSIEKYRKAHGDYQEIEELRSIHLISDSLYNKISPYLKLKE